MRRVGAQEALRAGDWIISNPAVQIHPAGTGLAEAWQLFQSLQGKASLVDCGSFEVMRSLGLSRAFAFDPDFQDQGFEKAE